VQFQTLEWPPVMRWTKRFLKRLALSEPKAPTLKSSQPNLQRQHHSLGSLENCARDAAARWYATRIKCALAATTKALFGQIFPKCARSAGYEILSKC
jgi:hypothetical protein